MVVLILTRIVQNSDQYNTDVYWSDLRSTEITFTDNPCSIFRTENDTGIFLHMDVTSTCISVELQISDISSYELPV
jgi:hypothetical protein